jgi:hypothetical protein
VEDRPVLTGHKLALEQAEVPVPELAGAQLPVAVAAMSVYPGFV